MAVEKKFVREAVGRLLIKEFLRKETERAGFGGIDIQRTPMGTRVSIVAERPGMVIGRKGSTINALTADLDRRFKVENPQIEVIEAGHDANLNAQIMAHKLAEALERGWHFRRAGHSTVQRVMGSGAQGCQVIVSGKLTGQRHRTEKFSQGHIKYCGETADRVMDVGFAVAKKKLGVIGCTVRIMRAEHRLPDNIEIRAAVPVPAAPAVLTPQAKPEAKAAAKPSAAREAAAAEPAKKAPAKRPKAARAAKKQTPAKEPKAESGKAVQKEAPAEEAKPEAVKAPEKETPAEEGKAEAVKAPAVASPGKEEPTASKKEAGVQPPPPEPGPEPEKPAKGVEQQEPKPEPEAAPEPEKPAESSKRKGSATEDVGEAAGSSEAGGET